jgi:hypothetical protein
MARKPGIRERLAAARREGAEAMRARAEAVCVERMRQHESTWQDLTQDQMDRDEALYRSAEARVCSRYVSALEVE